MTTAKEVHLKLLTDISDDMVKDSAEYNNFITHMTPYVPRGILAEKETFLGKLDAMATKGYLGIGKYEHLEKVAELSGCMCVKEMLQDAKHKLQELDQGAATKRPSSSTDEGTATKKRYSATQRLQALLTKRYLAYNIKIPISYNVESLEARVEDIYVPPTLRQIPLSHETGHEGRQQQLPDVHSYHEIFHRHTKLCQNVYIKGDAGTGKTTYCKRLVYSWCRYIKNEELESCEEFIKNFSFLFYIPLRNVVDLTDMDQMIYVHLLNQHADNMVLVRRILDEESEKCLVILDGLDEYTCKAATGCTEISKGLPHRDVNRRCTIVTTTRPWKVEAIRRKPAEMDQLIELRGLDEESSKEYIPSLVKCLNHKFGRNLSGGVFEMVLARKKLHKLRTLPVVLRYMVCMWHDGRSLGNSLCDIYSGIIEMLLQMSETKTTDCDELQKLEKHGLPPGKSLPSCFSDRKNCHEFGALLMSLSRIAFNTLFDENRESSLVFDTSTAELHGMSSLEIQASLQIGLLSQDIVLEHCSVQQKSISFLHKTVQECLAAMHVYMCPDEEIGIYNTICHSFASVEIVLEMSEVLMFMSGMVPRMVKRLSEFFGGVVSVDKRIQEYRDGADDDSRLVQSIQDMIIDCMKESSRNGHPGTSLYIEDIVLTRADDDEVRGDSGGGDVGGGGSVVSRGTARTSKCIRIKRLTKCNNGHIKSICIKNYSRIRILQRVTQTGVLQRLSWSDKQHVKGANHQLFGIIDRSRDSLKYLDIFYCDMSVLDRPISDKLRDLSQLQAVRLWYVTFSHEQMQWLMMYLSKRTELRRIELCDLKCRAGDQCSHDSLDLSQHTQLITVTLFGISGTDQVRINPSCLQMCRLRYLRPGVMASVMRSLRDSACLQGLELWNCPDEEQDTLIDTIPTLHHVKYMMLHTLDLGGRTLTLSRLMTQLERVNLWGSKMSLQSVRSFVDSLPTTQRVDVGMVCIAIKPQEDADAALEYITFSPKVQMDHESSISGQIMDVNFHTTRPVSPNESH